MHVCVCVCDGWIMTECSSDADSMETCTLQVLNTGGSCMYKTVPRKVKMYHNLMLICITHQSQEEGRGKNWIKDRKKGLR